MKYFIDTEFIEGFHKPLFGKKRHFIDLISIGIVAEDGRKFYQLSCEYNYNDADEWVKENVILPLYLKTVSGDQRNRHTVETFHKFYGLKNYQIADAVRKFVNPLLEETPLHDKDWNDHLNKFNVVASENRPIEFYAYYADYDWVVFCSLFGRMIDLPKGYPMYCNDLKQTMDEIALAKDTPIYRHFYPQKYSLDDGLKFMKMLPNYPTQENEHSALDDAKWNFQLFEFLQKCRV